jgi:hypothetical protein
MSADKTFREGFAVLSRHGLSYDVSLYHPQINEVADLAGAFPDMRIVFNHVGGSSASAPIAASAMKCFRAGRHRSRRWLPALTFTLRWADWARARDAPKAWIQVPICSPVPRRGVTAWT